MGNTFYFGWEVSFMEWLQSVFGSGFFLQFFKIITEFGDELVCIAILGMIYWGFNKEIGKFVGLNVATQLVWNPMIKNIFMRRRPYFDNPEIKILKPVDSDADIYDIAAQGYSFPSGHSSMCVSAYGSIFAKINKKWIRILCVVITLLVGLSRSVLGAHYPTDVLCGWLLGFAIILLVPFLNKKIKNEYVFYGILLLSGIPGFFYCTSTDFYTGYGVLLGGILAFIFDEKVVKFENTKNVFRCILRTVGGGVIYVVLNALLKLPFSEEFLASATTGAFIVRTVRYTIVLFVAMGVYPMLFKYTAKLGRKDAK